MRNLKRVLALALAVVMMIGMMVTASAATYADSADITANYKAAVNVTSDMGIFKGQTTGFAPKATLTRAEAAAIIYRVMTTDVTDSKVSIYDYASLKDIEAGKWYTGYVTYANNGGYVKGDGTNFYPLQTVTGVQFLAMMLRAMGYGQNGEFEGAAWKDMVLTKATDLGLVKNIVNVASLDAPASRELVAQLLFDGLQATTTYYTPALGYIPTGTTLGAKFGLTKTDYADKWGRPGVTYTFTTGTKSSIVMDTPISTYTVAVSDCQIAVDMKLKADAAAILYYDNGKAGTTAIDLDSVRATNGAQGTLIEVYKDRIVEIDTLLANVVEVADATYDAKGHLVTPSKIVLDVYDTDGTAANDRHYQTNGTTNYTYKKGDMILINAHLNGADVVEKWDGEFEYMEIVKAAPSAEGAQTVIWYSADQHTVNGTTYNDAARFHLNVAATSTANRLWYFDQYGNLIGAVEIATQYGYAAVKNMWWAGDPATGTGAAKATLVYMDGTENVVTVNGIKLDTGATKFAVPTYAGTDAANDMVYAANTSLKVATYVDTNRDADANGVITYARDAGEKGHLFQVETLANGAVNLTEVTLEATANITAKFAVITGDLKVNSNTQFLLYNTTTKTFSAFSDFNNMPNFKNSTAVIDYVKGTDGYAKYVYIIGTPDSTTSYNFVMPLSVNHSALLKNNGVDYWQVNITNVDGTQTALNVKTSEKTTVLDVLVNAANTKKLYYVTFTGDYATGLVEITGLMYGGTGNALPTMAATLGVMKLVDDADTSIIKRTGNDLAWSWAHFNVTSATEIVGALPEGRQTAKNVYVLFNAANNEAVKIWVVDNGATAPGVTAATINAVNVTAPATIAKDDVVASKTVRVDAVSDKAGNFFNAAQLAATKATVVWQKLNETTGVYENYEGTLFVSGKYQAVVTLSTTATTAAGQPYTLPAAVTVTESGSSAITTVDYQFIVDYTRIA